MNAPIVVVVGSLHTDLIARAPTMPELGTSVMGTCFSAGPGGKAANQAGQISKLGVACTLLARVGQDRMGDGNVAALVEAGVDTRLIIRDPAMSTGTSTVFAIAGEYASIIVPDAGLHFTTGEVDSARNAIADAKFVIGQLEIPHSVTEAAFAWARDGGVRTVLNASPLTASMGRDVQHIFRLTDVLVINRVEAELIAECPIATDDDATQAINRMRDQFGFEKVVITLGPRGAILASGEAVIHHDAYRVEVVDTVGSGDAFLGGLVAGWAVGETDTQALRRACACGALAATSPGAFASLPDLNSVLEMMTRA